MLLPCFAKRNVFVNLKSQVDTLSNSGMLLRIILFFKCLAGPAHARMYL